LRRHPSAALGVLLAALLGAAPAAAVNVSKTVDLSFGAVVPGLTSGTVVLAADGTGRSKTGGVILFTQGAGATGSRAQFTVSAGPANTACAIDLPGSAVSATGPGADMAVAAFTSSPAPTIMLDSSGAGVFYVGATLSVGVSQAAGPYSANFSAGVTCP